MHKTPNTQDAQALSDAARLYALFDEFKSCYSREWARLDRMERLYRCAHWDDTPKADGNEPRPTTPVIQSMVENLKAELYGSFPQAIITADDPEYEETAELLTNVVAENHLRCGYEQEYGKLLHDLLVGGYAIQEVGFDPDQGFSLGGAYIRHVDNRCIMFDPLAKSIEDCRAIFKFSAYPKAWFALRMPEIVEKLNCDSFSVSRNTDGIIDASNADSVLLIECWERELDPDTGKLCVHMRKLAGGMLIEDSKKQKPEGLFAHGKFPFVLTKLFPRKGSMLGLGYADMFEQQQRFSDKLDQIVMKNALMASHNKLLVSTASGFDVNDLRDWSKEVHRGENLNGVRWFSTAPLPSYIIDYIERMRNSIKEESGSNDSSRGNIPSGITAASAILALQEKSNKRARMIASTLFYSFAEAVRLEIEVEREYSVFKRRTHVRDLVTSFSAKQLYKTVKSGLLPLEFNVTVRVQNEGKFSLISRNDDIFRLFELGMLEKDTALSLLRFNSGENIADSIRAMQSAQNTLTSKEVNLHNAPLEKAAR